MSMSSFITPETIDKDEGPCKSSLYLCTSANTTEKGEPMDFNCQSPHTLSPMEEDFQTQGPTERIHQNFEMLKSVKTANRNIEHHIGILRTRNNAIESLYEEERGKLKVSEERRQKQEEEIEELTDSLSARDERIRVLAQQKAEQDHQLNNNEKTITVLEQAVQKAEHHKIELSKQFEDLQRVNERLNSIAPQNGDQSDVRNELQHELSIAKERLRSMESELLRAKEIIELHSEQILSLEKRVDETTHFKDDLDRASRAMNDESNRINEAMNKQSKEIRNLRLELRNSMQKQDEKMEFIQKQNHDILKQGQHTQQQHNEEMRLIRAQNENMCRMMMDLQNSSYAYHRSDIRNLTASEPLSVVKLNISGNRRRIQTFSNINNKDNFANNCLQIKKSNRYKYLIQENQ